METAILKTIALPELNNGPVADLRFRRGGTKLPVEPTFPPIFPYPPLLFPYTTLSSSSIFRPVPFPEAGGGGDYYRTSAALTVWDRGGGAGTLFSWIDVDGRLQYVHR